MRYSSQYEERLDPFASFSKKVREIPSVHAHWWKHRRSLWPVIYCNSFWYSTTDQAWMTQRPNCAPPYSKYPPWANTSASKKQLTPNIHYMSWDFPNDVFVEAILCLQERQRRYLSLSPWDKATLSLVSLNLTHTHTHTHSHSLYMFYILTNPLLCLSGPWDSLQQDGQDCCFLLHLVPALFGLPGGSPFSPSVSPVGCSDLYLLTHSFFFFLFFPRCCTKPPGVRVSVEIAPPFAQKSEFVHNIYIDYILYELRIWSAGIWCHFSHFQVLWPPAPFPWERPKPLSWFSSMHVLHVELIVLLRTELHLFVSAVTQISTRRRCRAVNRKSKGR